MRRDRPARAAAARSGGSPTTSTGSPGSPTPASRRWPGTWRVVKPQSAFFERHGSRGDRGAGAAAGRRSPARRRSCCWTSSGATSARRCRATPTPTSRDGAPLAADAVTLSPYLGFGSLAPALDTAADGGPRGVRAGPDVERRGGGGAGGRRRRDGRWRRGSSTRRPPATAGVAPLGGVGLVVGATADHGLDLAALNGPVLAPGLGAQGAGPADIAARFRGVRRPRAAVGEPLGPRGGSGRARLRAAAEALRDELAAARLTRAPARCTGAFVHRSAKLCGSRWWPHGDRSANDP